MKVDSTLRVFFNFMLLNFLSWTCGVHTVYAAPSFIGIESFEDLQPGGNIVLDRDLRLRIVGPTTFESGVTVSGPFPQDQVNSSIGVHDCARSCGFGLSDNGDISSANDVPDGSAHFAVSDQDEIRPLEFTFSEEMQFVSALVTGAFYSPNPSPSGRTITLTAFNSFGDEIKSTSMESVHVSQWSQNLISISAPGIKKVTFNGYVYVLDRLTFSTIPEPSTAALLLSGVGFFMGRRRR